MMKYSFLIFAVLAFNVNAQDSVSMGVGNPDSENTLIVDQAQVITQTQQPMPNTQVEGVATDDVAVYNPSTPNNDLVPQVSEVINQEEVDTYSDF